MKLISVLFFLGLFSWLPASLLAVLLAVVMRNSARPGAWTILGSGLVGIVWGVLLLYPLAELDVVLLLTLGAALAAAVSWFGSGVRGIFLAALAFVVGAQLAVPFGPDGVFTASQSDPLWAMPILDMWLVVGLPALVAGIVIVVVKRASARPRPAV